MGEYECERNVELQPKDVEAVLVMARACLEKGHDGITILDQKTRDFRIQARIKATQIIECIRQLELTDYSTTSIKPGNHDAHVFGAEINGYDIYIKFQIVEDTLVVKVISFHEQEWEMRYAYR